MDMAVDHFIPGYGIPGGVKDTLAYGSEAIRDAKSGKPEEAVLAVTVATANAIGVAGNVAVTGAIVAAASVPVAAGAAIGLCVAVGVASQTRLGSNIEQGAANAIVNAGDVVTNMEVAEEKLALGSGVFVVSTAVKGYVGLADAATGGKIPAIGKMEDAVGRVQNASEATMLNSVNQLEGKSGKDASGAKSKLPY
jgi:hypothetical protein